MNTLTVSSYSLREQMGPLTFDFTDADGSSQHYVSDNPRLLGVADFPQRAKDTFGVDGIETVAFQFTGLEDPELDRFDEALDASGVRLVNVAIDTGDLLEADDARRAEHIAELKRWIARFAAMGSSFVRVNPGSPFSPHHGEAPPAHLVAALQELGAFATAEGSRLLVENHGGPSSDPAWIGRLLDAVGEEACGLLLDLGNFDVLLAPAMALLFGGEGGVAVDPAAVFADIDLEPLYDGIEALASRAELVHVKAHVVGDDGAVGVVDLDRAIGILAAHGYDGPLTVEYEGSGGDPWAKSLRVLEVTRDAVAATNETKEAR